VLGWTLRDLLRPLGRFDALLGSVVGLLTLASWLVDDPSPLATLGRGARWLGVDVTNALSGAEAWIAQRDGTLFVVWSFVLSAAIVLRLEALSRDLNEEQRAARMAARARDAPTTDDADEPQLPRVREYWSWDNELRFWSIAWFSIGFYDQLGRVPWFAPMAVLVAILLPPFVSRFSDELDRLLHDFHETSRKNQPKTLRHHLSGVARALVGTSDARRELRRSFNEELGESVGFPLSRAMSVLLALPTSLLGLIFSPTVESPSTDADRRNSGVL